MININSLSYKENNTSILDNINASFQDGEITAIIGEAGSGKTSLLKAIAGRVKNNSGEILINGKQLSLFSSKETEKLISSLFTRNARDIIDDTVFNFMLHSRIIYKKTFNPFSELDIQIAEEYIKKMQLGMHRDRKISTVSDGIFKRIMLASVFIKNTEIVLFDNPTNDLDLPSIYLLEKAIIKYVMNGDKIIIISSNDLNFTLNIADKLLVMKNGGIDAELTPYDVNADFIKKYFKSEVLLSRNIYNGKPGIQQFAAGEG